MRIAIFGLGYVGTVTGACFAMQGHKVVGVDINSEKVKAINQGKSPIIERELDDVIASGVKAGNFSGASSTKEAIAKTDMAMICVGTPSMESGAINVGHLKSVAEDIGKALKNMGRFYTIVIRSTVLPGTTEDVLIPAIEQASGKKLDKGFAVCVNPEFMREGNSLEDFYKPAKTIIGAASEREADLLKRLYSFTQAPIIVSDIKTAEFSKYLDNVFHGLKISFANEIGNIAKKSGLDPVKAMEIFCKDTVSNISPRYLKPGFAFGGSCLPKDIKALLYKAKTQDLDIPLINSILRSNDMQVDIVARDILRTGKKKIGMLGLSFKPGTDDLRESQLVRLAEILIGKGLKLKIYDKNIAMAKLVGANRKYINKEIPHISSLLCKRINEAIRDSELIILGHDTKEFKEAVKKLKKPQILMKL
ncbi:MAG: nucleotide sugar dehydrogenase [Candidatus Omnitrophota bacterium]